MYLFNGNEKIFFIYFMWSNVQCEWEYQMRMFKLITGFKSKYHIFFFHQQKMSNKICKLKYK